MINISNTSEYCKNKKQKSNEIPHVIHDEYAFGGVNTQITRLQIFVWFELKEGRGRGTEVSHKDNHHLYDLLYDVICHLPMQCNLSPSSLLYIVSIRFFEGVRKFQRIMVMMRFFSLNVEPLMSCSITVKYCMFGIWIPQLGMCITKPSFTNQLSTKIQFLVLKTPIRPKPYKLHTTVQSEIRLHILLHTSIQTYLARLIPLLAYNMYAQPCCLQANECCSTSLHNFLFPQVAI